VTDTTWRDGLSALAGNPAALEQRVAALKLTGGPAAEFNRLARFLDGPARLNLLETAVRFHPDDFWLHMERASLYEAGPLCRFAEAAGAYEAALAVSPDQAIAWFGQGRALQSMGDDAGAIACYRKAIRNDSEQIDAQVALSTLLLDGGDVTGALDNAQVAIQLNPNHAPAHFAMGLAWRERKDMDQAIEHLRRACELFPECRSMALALQQTERWRQLDPLLADVVAGKQTPAPRQLVDLAELCLRYHQRNRAALRLYRDAFAADPEIVRDTDGGHAAAAAAAAVAASFARDEESEHATPEDRAAWRKEALAWLDAQLQAWLQVVASQPDKGPVAREALLQWQKDRVFAAVRDEGPLTSLAADEQEPWRRFWADVAGLTHQWHPHDD